MKHIITVCLIGLVAFSAKAQIFAGANAGVAYSNEVFSMTAEPYIGYEFNDKVAAGTGVGISVYDGESSTVFNPFLRFTPWQNETIALDVKVQSIIQVYDGCGSSITGLSPSIRIKLSDKWQLSTDLGVLGAYCDEGDWGASFALKNVNVNATVIYRFNK